MVRPLTLSLLHFICAAYSSALLLSLLTFKTILKRSARVMWSWLLLSGLVFVLLLLWLLFGLLLSCGLPPPSPLLELLLILLLLLLNCCCLWRTPVLFITDACMDACT